MARLIVSGDEILLSTLQLSSRALQYNALGLLADFGSRPLFDFTLVKRYICRELPKKAVSAAREPERTLTSKRQSPLNALLRPELQPFPFLQ